MRTRASTMNYNTHPENKNRPMGPKDDEINNWGGEEAMN